MIYDSLRMHFWFVYILLLVVLLVICSGFETQPRKYADYAKQQQDSVSDSILSNRRTKNDDIISQQTYLLERTGENEQNNQQNNLSMNKKNSNLSAREVMKMYKNELKEANSTAEASTKSKSKKSKVVALITVITISGFGSLGILLACLYYKYRARLHGYKLLMKKDVRISRKEKNHSKPTDYATLDTISEETIFLGNEDSCSEDDHNTYEDSKYKTKRPSKERKTESFEFISNSHVSALNEPIKTDVNRSFVSECVDSYERDFKRVHSSSEEIKSPDKILGKFRKWRQWTSMNLQCNEALDSQLSSTKVNRDVTLQRNDGLSFNSDKNGNDGNITTKDIDDVSRILSTHPSNSSTSEDSFEQQYNDNLAISNQELNYEQEAVHKWNKNKRQSIQAAIYNVSSDSDSDYELTGSLHEPVKREAESFRSSQRMSDLVIFFDYTASEHQFSPNHEKLERKSPDTVTVEKHVDYTNVDGDSPIHGCLAKQESIQTGEFSRAQSGQKNTASYLAKHEEILQESSTDKMLNGSVPVFNEKLSRDETNATLTEIMHDISSSIYFEGVKNMLHRCSSDSQLITEKKTELSSSCMDLKSFSTSNLRGVHLMPLTLSSFAKTKPNSSPRTKARKSLQHRLRTFKGIFKKRKKNKQRKKSN